MRRLGKLEWIGNGDESTFSLELVAKFTIEAKGVQRVPVRVRGRYKDNIALYVSFFVQVEHGVDDDGDACLKLTNIFRLKPVLMWKGQLDSKIENHLKRDARGEP